LKVTLTLEEKYADVDGAKEMVYVSSNSLSLALLPIPILVSTLPQIVYNIRSLNMIQVSGQKFISSAQMTCVFQSSASQLILYKSKGLVLSPSTAECPLPQGREALRDHGEHLKIAVSNDDGRTLSNYV